MAEYRLRITEEEVDDSRERTLEELYGFIREMDGRPLAVVTLDREQSLRWDEEGETDYQDAYGRRIVRQVADGITETLLIRDSDGLPLALAAVDPVGGWRGLGIDKRLRGEIAVALRNDEAEFD